MTFQYAKRRKHILRGGNPFNREWELVNEHYVKVGDEWNVFYWATHPEHTYRIVEIGCMDNYPGGLYFRVEGINRKVSKFVLRSKICVSSLRHLSTRALVTSDDLRLYRELL